MGSSPLSVGGATHSWILPQLRVSLPLSFLLCLLWLFSRALPVRMYSSCPPPLVSTMVFPVSPIVSSSFESTATSFGRLDLLYTPLVFSILWAPVLSILRASDTCLTKGELKNFIIWNWNSVSLPLCSVCQWLYMWESDALFLASLMWFPHLSDPDLAVSPTYLTVGSPLSSIHSLHVDSYIKLLRLQFSGFLAMGHARHFFLPHGLVSNGLDLVSNSLKSTPLLSTSLYFQPVISPTLFSSPCIFLRSKASLVAGTKTGADSITGFLLLLVFKDSLGSPVPGPPLGETAASLGSPVARSPIPGPPLGETTGPLGSPVPGPPLGETRSLIELFCIGCLLGAVPPSPGPDPGVTAPFPCFLNQFSCSENFLRALSLFPSSPSLWRFLHEKKTAIIFHSKGHFLR